MVEREVEPPVYVGLDLVLLATVLRHLQAIFESCQLRRRAMLVGGTDVQDIVAPLALEAGLDVCRQHRADKIPEMLVAIAVGQSTCNEDSCHRSVLL